MRNEAASVYVRYCLLKRSVIIKARGQLRGHDGLQRVSTLQLMGRRRPATLHKKLGTPIGSRITLGHVTRQYLTPSNSFLGGRRCNNSFINGAICAGCVVHTRNQLDQGARPGRDIAAAARVDNADVTSTFDGAIIRESFCDVVTLVVSS
jgi:hypothetical protein